MKRKENLLEQIPETFFTESEYRKMVENFINTNISNFRTPPRFTLTKAYKTEPSIPINYSSFKDIYITVMIEILCAAKKVYYTEDGILVNSIYHEIKNNISAKNMEIPHLLGKINAIVCSTFGSFLKEQKETPEMLQYVNQFVFKSKGVGEILLKMFWVIEHQ